ncbi:MAG: alpha/beta fold hydrolase [Bacteroidota bacterium]
MRNIQFYKHIITCALLILFQIVGAQTSNDIQWTDCFLADCSELNEFPNIKFGYLTVPEDYNQPNKRKIKIAFAIVTSTDKNPKPDPILFFQGGWGATMLNSISYYARNYSIKDRDLILFDYRGSGYSEPKLCDWLGEETWEDIKANLTNKKFENNQTQRFNKCLDSLELRGIDYNQYGSNTKTKDAVKLAEALGYESYNLSGISYGTRAILNFIRNTENSNLVIRSIVMDSNSPIGGVLHHGTMIYAYTEVLNNIFKDCEQNPDCNKNFPNLKARFIAYLLTLDKDPWVIQLEDSSTFAVNKEELNAYVHQLLYNQSLYKYFPVVLDHFIAKDNNVFKLMVTQIEGRAKSNYNGLGLINFVYDHKFFRDTTEIKYNQILAKNPSYKIMDAYLDFFFKDKRIATDSLEHIPVKSNIPALFLAGTYDPITPPSWTKFTASGFSNKFYYEAPRFGHGISPTECGKTLVRQFIDNPIMRPDNSCFEELGENIIPFQVDYYKNSKIGILFKRISDLNLLLLIALIIIVLASLVNSVRFVVKLFKRKSSRNSDLNFSFFLILTFFIGLIPITSKTISEEPFLILFGLIKEANYVLYLCLVALIVGLFQLIRWLRSNDKKNWDYVSAISFILFLIFVINYNLFPNL